MSRTTTTTTEVRTDTEPLWDTEDLARYLGMPFHTVRGWRSRRPVPVGPPFLAIGKRVRYRRADVDAWLESRTSTTADMAA